MKFTLMWESLPTLLSGAVLTVQLVALALVIGFGLAVVIALARLGSNPLISGAARFYIFVFRGTPLLLQIFLIYYGLAQFEWVRESIFWLVLKEAYWAAIIALALNTAAYTAELMRGGISGVPKGQVEAALACGMGRITRYRRIILPTAFRQILPAYGNEIILMVKASSLASTITLMEITGIAERIIARTFSPLEVFAVAGAIYLAINFAVTLGVEGLERRYNKGLRLASAAR